MKRIFKTSILALLIISLFSITTFAASTDSSKAADTGYIKQVMLIPTATEGSYDMYVYANVQIDSPYVKNGYRWVNIRRGIELTPADKEEDFSFSYASTEYLVNYFLDDYYFIFENAGMSEFQPYYLIEKSTNKIVANPALYYVGDYQFKASELKKHFGIELQEVRYDRYSRVVLLTLNEKYVLEGGNE